MSEATHDQRITAPAVITEVLDDRTYSARMPNGKMMLAFYPRLRVGPALKADDAVTLAISLYDFSQGEIVETPA